MNYSGAAASFNSKAGQYDAARPTYPVALIRYIINRAQLTEESRLLEIGSGTGKATLPFAQRDYQMLCLEPGIEMGKILRQNLRPFPNTKVKTATFESWRTQRNSFDLIFSAQAFHWVDPEIGFPKAAEALKPGGWIALFWNLPYDPNLAVFKKIQKVYKEVAPDMERRHRRKALSKHVGDIRRDLAKHRELFSRQFLRQFIWSKTYTTQEYLDLLGTYSDHIALAPRRRARLYKAISEIIDAQGGTLRRQYTCVLAMGQKHLP